MENLPPISVDIVSDVMCPWCYIGKRRLEAALKQRPDLDITVQWHPFQLDPTIPKGGMDRQEYLNRKFGGPEGAKSIYANIVEAGKLENIPFAFDLIPRSPNTIDSHRLIHWSKEQGFQDALVERLFEMYFTEGKDIGDHAVLLAAAKDAGMDVEKVKKLLASDTDCTTIETSIASAQKMGIQGVPYFIIAGKYALSGAQSPEVIVALLDRVQKDQAP